MDIEAKLEYIIFENKANHYVVAGFSELKTYHHFTAAGRIEDPIEDQEYVLEGDYITHPKYGEQFRIDMAKKKLPDNSDAIIHFLCGENFPTIGKKTAESIYDVLGENCLEKIHKDPKILNEVPNLSEKKIAIIKKGIQEFTGFNEAYAKLLKYGLSPRQIQMLLDTYDDVLDVIEEDCFKPYYEVYGFGYKTALKLASAIGLSNEDPRRLDAYIYELARQLSMATGNTYITFATIFSNVQGVSEELIHNSIDRLVAMQYLYVENTRIYPFTFEITCAVCDTCGGFMSVPGIIDLNVHEIDEQYRKLKGLVSIEDIHTLMELYNIGKAPNSTATKNESSLNHNWIIGLNALMPFLLVHKAESYYPDTLLYIFPRFPLPLLSFPYLDHPLKS
jgi:hypothetical protein